ncbi:class I SAM-dependent methyltransferase [Natronolimnohabitans innermongolicus]|nr:methyltransferase domain-containing protein [Natronolimnohabitans innermongolicus]
MIDDDGNGDGDDDADTDRPTDPRARDDPLQPPGPIARVRRPTTAARDWYDFLSGRYDALADPFEAEARATGLEILDVQPGERVLDIGCGTGRALVDLADAVGPTGTAVGIDVADGMCRVSSRALSEAGLESGVVVAGDAATLPFRDDAFDALFSSFVLELFDTPALGPVLEEWRRVLDPDGRLCVVSLSRRGDGPIVRLYETVRKLAPTYADCRPIYLRETLLEGGFQVLEARSASVWRFPVEIVCCRPGATPLSAPRGPA